MHSLKAKITMLTVWITVVAVAVVTLLSVLFIRDAEHSKSDQLLLLLCETGERNLDYYFNSVEKSVKKIASYTEKELDGLEDEKLLAHTERIRKYFEEVASKTNGVLTYYYRIDPAVSKTAKGFWYTDLEGTGFTEHEVTDITEYDTEDTSSLVWFTVPKYEGSAVWLPPYFTENLDVEVFSYNVPIYFRGQFVGVVGIEIDYSAMAEQVDSIRLYNNGYAFLTDKDGNLIFHPRMNLAALDDEEIPATPDSLLSESSFTRYTYEGMQKEAVALQDPVGHGQIQRFIGARHSARRLPDHHGQRGEKQHRGQELPPQRRARIRFHLPSLLLPPSPPGPDPEAAVSGNMIPYLSGKHNRRICGSCLFSLLHIRQLTDRAVWVFAGGAGGCGLPRQ